MTDNALRRLEPKVRAALILFATTVLAIVATGSQTATDQDSVRVSSVQTYLAREIETGEAIGRFLLVRANVKMAEATRAQLDVRRALPIVLAARLEVNGKQLLPCGAGSILGPLPLGVPLQSGEPISALFYLPERTLGRAKTVNLITVVQVVDGRSFESPIVPLVPPVARAPVPWPPERLDEAGAAHVELIGVGTEERQSSKNLDATSLIQAIRLRLPEGLPRVLRGGNGKLHCDDEVAKSLGIGDILVARFESPVDPSNCRWELRFPAFGVKLQLAMRKP